MSELGIVSARHVDHIGITVPDLDVAIHFYQQALDARLLWRVGPFAETPTDAVIKDVYVAMLRLGPNINLELQYYEANEQSQKMPSNIDYGATHVAIFVNDIEAAAASLKKHGAELLRGPIKSQGEIKKGETIWYFKTPWGAFMELVWRPEDLGYEKTTANRLYQPNDCWVDQPS